MTRYSTSNGSAGGTVSTTYKTFVSLTAATATLTRGELLIMDFGPSGPPNSTDCSIVYDLSRQTSLGTGTAFTPTPIDNTSSASGSVGTINYTIEPTITANSTMFQIGLNQRSSMHVQLDQGFRWPATNVNGLVLRALSTIYASSLGCTTIHNE